MRLIHTVYIDDENANNIEYEWLAEIPHIPTTISSCGDNLVIRVSGTDDDDTRNLLFEELTSLNRKTETLLDVGGDV